MLEIGYKADKCHLCRLRLWEIRLYKSQAARWSRGVSVLNKSEELEVSKMGKAVAVAAAVARRRRGDLASFGWRGSRDRFLARLIDRTAINFLQIANNANDGYP